ncbi:uncharacterized protein KGF55_001220 [Candida pseudojiufengensis]|uniref:uncharacterized protein n=1 Tax=Candida pseudojiufengensis TaxID=497109 RepID=UPI002224475A|nr:uncharacterized protein KGF55_001220 [Candida pseudojiufengensis]KAI5965857.1 hypothetical protein KGF55_001220 [Candida pseudojiufengensis]
MDNRKIYKTYRDNLKSNTIENSKPYSLTSKLKNILKRPWNSSNSDSQSINNQNLSTENKSFKFPEPKIISNPNSTKYSDLKDYKIPGSFSGNLPTSSSLTITKDIETPNTTIKEITHRPLESKIEEEEIEEIENPNDILSDFFKKKGNNKLSDVEYEGVMSLISKSKSGTPYKRKFFELDQESIDNDRKKRQINNNLSLLNGNNTSIIESTPNKQKILKQNGNITISYPDNKFNYSTVNSTFDKSYQNINNTTFGSRNLSSTGRSLYLSRRPAPYKSRLRGPIYTKKSNTIKSDDYKNLNNSILSTQSILKSNVNDDSKIINEKSKPNSKTAQILLDILDGNKNQKDQDDNEKVNKDSNNNKINLFTNPYESSRSKKKSKSIPITQIGIEKSSNTKVNGNEINSNSKFSFNRLKSKEEEESKEEEKSKEEKSKEEKSKEGVKSKEEAKSIEQKEHNNGSSETKTTKSSKTSLFGNSHSLLGQTFQTVGLNGNSSVTSNNKPTKPSNFDLMKYSKENTQPKFSFNPNSNPNSNSNLNPNSISNSSPASKQTPTQKQSENGEKTTNGKADLNTVKQTSESHQTSEFEFPDTDVVHVELDNTEVNKYKSLYSF